MEEVLYDFGESIITSPAEMTDFSVEPEKTKLADEDISYIVLAVDNKNFAGVEKPYEIDVLGKPMVDWVVDCCKKRPIVKVVSPMHTVLDEIKPLLRDSEWTVVLYSDTPLLKASTIADAFNFAKSKSLNVCKLTRGYIFKTEYIKRVNEIFCPETYYFDEEDFIIASTFKQLSIIRDIMRNRITEYFLRSGVDLRDPSSTYIECEVSIGSGTIIYGGNQLTGKVEIGKDVILYSNNQLNNCKICANSVVEGASIQNSVVGESSCIRNSILMDSVVTESDVKIENYSVVEKTKLELGAKVDNANLKNVRLNAGAKVGAGSVLKTENGTIRLFPQCEVGEKCLCTSAVKVGEKVVVPAGTTILQDINA